MVLRPFFIFKLVLCRDLCRPPKLNLPSISANPLNMVSFWHLFCLHKKFLVYNMVVRNLKIKYRRSMLGFLWTLLIPVSQAAIYYLVFQRIMKVQIDHYVPFILSGILFWVFLSNTLNESTESLLANCHLLSKIPIPLQTFPWVASLSHGLNLFLALPVIFAVMLLNGIPLRPINGLVFGFALEILIIAYSLGLILSVVMVYFRDLRYLLNLGLQLLMYGTPILYEEKMIPESFRWLLWINPVGTLFPSIHQVLIEGTWPQPSALLITLGWTVGLLLLAREVLSRALRKGVVEWL